MNKENAEKIITEYLKAIYGFSVKHCKTLEDAEDLSQEIIFKVFIYLIRKDDIESESKLIWTIAHNCLCNYYRSTKHGIIGLPIDELFDLISDNNPTPEDDFIIQETIDRLHTEIAYLSKLQRKIVIAYYYENKKQQTIANEFAIPIGTVKWHLFEAKKDLKKGMEKMRNYKELKFNPIKFSYMGYSGTKGDSSNLLDSILAQNIEYCVWKEAKSINQIADELGVSPVYIEDEAEKLEEYGYLLFSDGKYLCNIMLNIPTKKIVDETEKLYSKASEIFANELYDELVNSEILESDEIAGAVKTLTLDTQIRQDKNFILWALIPYIASKSGLELLDKGLSFDDVASYRPDGSKNICWATILHPEFDPPKYTDNIKSFYGPCQSFNHNFCLWQIDSKWSEKRINDLDTQHILYLLDNFGELLKKEDYAYLAEQGYMITAGDTDSLFKSAFKCVFLSKNIEKKLIAIGDKIKQKHLQEFEELKKPFIQAVLQETPTQLRRIQEYQLKFTFFGDAPFICYCLDELVKSGKLTPPTKEQKKSLHTVIVNKS